MRSPFLVFNRRKEFNNASIKQIKDGINCFLMNGISDSIL